MNFHFPCWPLPFHLRSNHQKLLFGVFWGLFPNRPKMSNLGPNFRGAKAAWAPGICHQLSCLWLAWLVVSQTGASPGVGGEPFLISLILAAPGLAGSYWESERKEAVKYGRDTHQKVLFLPSTAVCALKTRLERRPDPLRWKLPLFCRSRWWWWGWGRRGMNILDGSAPGLPRCLWKPPLVKEKEQIKREKVGAGGGRNRNRERPLLSPCLCAPHSNWFVPFVVLIICESGITGVPSSPIIFCIKKGTQKPLIIFELENMIIKKKKSIKKFINTIRD